MLKKAQVFYLEGDVKLRARNSKKLRVLGFGLLILLTALIVFQINIEQVAAEESVEDFEEPAETVVVVESFEQPEDKFSEKVTNYIEEKNKAPDDEVQDEFSDEEETDDKENATSEYIDGKERDSSDEKDVADSEESDENESDNISDKDEEVDSDEEASAPEGSDYDQEEETDVTEVTEENVEVDNKDIEEEAPKAMTASAKDKSKNKKVEVNRIAGQNRYKNAAELSKSGWKSASTVILTNGEKFTDSLTGSPLASLYDAPILLTRADRLPSETLAEIKRLNPKEVIVLGGDLSVSNSVFETLKANGFATRRIGGRTRYLLAENIAKEVMKTEGKNRDAFLVSGEVYSDAMSIASVAASKRLPIFLTRSNILDQTVVNAIPDVNMWTIIGGNLTIKQNVQKEMESLGAKTRRIDGKNRYDVNRNIIQHYGSSSNEMYVASGEHFTDATPASVLAAKKKSSVLLVKNKNKTNLKEQRDFANKRNINKLTLIGGNLTLSKNTEDYFNNQNYLIYLDPGHGGRETGAVGRVDGRQYIEKNLNLQVSFKVRNLLLDKGYEVFMSRTNDSFVSLQRRPEQANNLGADIFVSLHHNAMPNSTTTTGIETFYYIPERNYPPLDKNRPYHNDPTRIAGSKRLSEAIHGQLINQTRAYDRGVKRGAYAVVREAHMPAVLLEYGFMSTPAELRVMTQNSYQNRLAKATVDGIIRYFN